MNTSSIHETTSAAEAFDDPRNLTTLRAMRLLVGAYLGLSLLAVAAIVLLRDNTAIVNDAAWVRGTIVFLASILMFVFAVRASKGSRGAFLRVRIMSAAMLVAIVVIVSLPGTFPLWLKIEQAVCGAILLAVVWVVNGRRLRALFAAH